MDDLQRVAFVFSQSAAAMVELEARKLENAEAKAAGYAPPYSSTEIREIIGHHQIGWNDVLTYLGERR